MVRNRDPVMALTPEQTAALALLADADPKEVADGLKETAPNAYQTAFRVGYGTAKGEYEPKVQAAESAKAAAEAERDAAKAQAETLGGDQDSKVKALTERAEKAEKAAQDAKAAKDAAETEAAESIKGFYRKAQQNALLAKLAPTVDPVYAEQALVPKYADRIRIDGVGEDGAPTVAYLGADGVPLSGGLDALAAELAATVDARFKMSRVDAGGGAQNGAGGGSGYDPAKAGKAMAERQKAAAAEGSLAFQ